MKAVLLEGKSDSMKPDENLDLYHSFSDKLGASKKQIDVDESLRSSFDYQKDLHLQLKAIQDQGYFRIITLFLYGAGVLFFTLHLVLKGLWIGLLGIILLGAFYVVTKILLTQKLKKTSETFFDIGKKGLLVNGDVASLIKYNRTIVELKRTRLIVLLLMSVVFVPMFFLSLYEVIFKNYNFVIVALAIIFGSFFWMIFFYKDLVLIKEIKNRIVTI